MSDPETVDSPQLELIHSLLEGMRKGDVDLLARPLHKDLCRVTYPRSLGRPEYNKEDWLKQAAELFSLWAEDCASTVHSIVEVPGTVVTHLTAKVRTTVGVELTREMILIAHIVTDEDGNLKIKQLDEFTDSKAYLDFFKAVAGAGAGIQHPSHVA